MAIYEFDGRKPRLSPETFVHPEAVVIGDVTIGNQCFIGPGAVIRADFGSVVIKDGTSIQDNVVIHVNGNTQGVLIEEDVVVGHGAILHDVHIAPRCVIGMGAILLYEVVCGEGAIVAAGSVVRQGTQIPARKLVAGSPAKVIKDVPSELEQYIREGVALYRDLSLRYGKTLKRIG